MGSKEEPRTEEGRREGRGGDRGGAGSGGEEELMVRKVSRRR
jgi:hypothetical protein